jgi:hypothetical protein
VVSRCEHCAAEVVSHGPPGNYCWGCLRTTNFLDVPFQAATAQSQSWEAIVGLPDDELYVFCHQLAEAFNRPEKE